MRAAIYIRVSTRDQTTDNQLPDLVRWVKHRDFYQGKPYYIYRENESAWKAGHQKELNRLITDASRRRFDTVLVWALDRLSREGPLAILSLIHKLKGYGVQVISYQEPWTEAPGELGDLLFALTGWVARMESQRRSERTKAGIERYRDQGKPWGRPKGAKDKNRRKRRNFA